MFSQRTGRIYCQLPADKIAIFRFLLESRDNLAQFTVLDRKKAIIKVFFPADTLFLAQKALAEISEEIPLFWEYDRASG